MHALAWLIGAALVGAAAVGYVYRPVEVPAISSTEQYCRRGDLHRQLGLSLEDCVALRKAWVDTGNVR